jgi:hypothetical protein
MLVCPECGEEVALGENTCGACGADVPPRRPRRLYFVSAAALAAIVLAAAFLHSFLQTRIVRSPTDFLPASTHAVIDVDVRPGSPAMLRIGSTWQESDAEILAGRAVELAQWALDWTGLKLDLSEDASSWFGGEVLVASIAPSRLRTLTPRSVVLIARVTDLHRARRDLDQSVAELAREGGWERSVLRAKGHTIVLWGHPNDRSEIAYAALDGCVLLSVSEDLVELCIETAESPSQRLTESAEFKEATRSLPADAFLWCYASAPDLIHTAGALLPELRRGWLGLARAFLRQSATPRGEMVPGGSSPAPGSVALALTPESDGLRLHANYWAGPDKAPSALSAESAKLLDLVPRDAVAFALVRGLPDLVSPLLPKPDRLPKRQAFTPFLFWDPMGFLLREGDLPEAVLVTVLPTDGKARELAIAAALSGPDAAETARRIQQLMPQAETAVVRDAQVFATDAEALRQIKQAAEDEAARLDISTQPDVRLQAWARPGEMWPALGKIGDAGFQVRDNATGAQMELSVEAEPRYLLGGR